MTEIERIEKLNKAKAEGTITSDQYTEGMRKLFKATKEVSTETAKATAAQMEMAKTFGDTIGQLDAARTLLKDYEKLNAQAVLTTEAKTEAERQAIEMQRAQIAALKDAADAAKEYIEEIEAMGPGYEEALRKGQPFFEDMATKMGLLSKGSNKFLRQIYELGAAAKKEGGLKGLAKGFTNVFNAANISVSIISKIAEATIAQATAVDKAGAAYAKSTGFGREFDGMLSATNDSMKRFNVSAEDVGKGLVSLRTGLSQFAELSASTQQNLLGTVVGLEKLGVAADDSAQTLNNLTKGLGMSETAANNLTREIALSGQALGMTASKITKEFNSSLATLAVYGDKAPEVFMKIASMAQVAGVEVNTLLGIANKFDTFADSAQTAAKMNAILGTSFSGVNMMMMDHGQRVEEVIKGMQATGTSFKNLDKFTQQAIAAQLGIKDMAQANKILGMSLGAYRDMQSQQKAADKTAEAMAKKMKAAMSIVDELKQIMAAFAIDVQPIIPFIKKVAEGFAGFLNFLKDFHPLTVLVSAGFIFITSKGLLAAGMVKVFGKVAGSSAPKVAALGASMGTLGFSMLGVGIGAALIAGSIALMFKVIFDGLVALAELDASFISIGFSMVGFGAGLYLVASAVGVLTAAFAGLGTIGSIGATVFVGVLTAMAAAATAVGFIINSVGKNSDIVTRMATSLKEVAAMALDIRAAFSAIGEGLSVSQSALDNLESQSGAKISSVLANVALITTGQAAGEMNQGGAGAALSRNLGSFIDSVGGYFSGEKDKDKSMMIQLDGPATTELLEGMIAKGHIKSGT